MKNSCAPSRRQNRNECDPSSKKNIFHESSALIPTSFLFSMSTLPHISYILLFLFFSISSYANGNTPQFEEAWRRLLHNVDNQNEVVSDDFFLSDERSPEKEFAVFVEGLNSTRGPDFACSFPARYLLVKK